MSNIAFAGANSLNSQGADRMQAAANQVAWEMFETSSRRGWLRRIWHTIRRQPTRFISLSTLDRVHPIPNSVNRDRQYISLKNICGTASEGRTNDFDSEFYPMESHSKERWMHVAAAWYLGKALPPVS